MKHLTVQIAVTLAAVAGSFVDSRAQEANREIGYIESFDESPEVYAIRRGENRFPVAIMTPILLGDRIEVRNSTAKIIVRLQDRSTPVTISKLNLDTPLSALPTQKPFWTPILAWVSKQIQAFDHEERTQISASIRGRSIGLSAPMLKVSQILPSGRQSVAVGWVGLSKPNVTLYDASGRTIAAGQGVDGLWFSPQFQFDPGNYLLELSAGSVQVKQFISFVSPSELPIAPSELIVGDQPVELRSIISAAWLGAQGPQFSLAGFQLVAPIASSFKPAEVLMHALVRGDRIEPVP